MRVVQVSIMAGVLVLAAACGGSGPGATGSAAPTAAACTGSGGTQVSVADFTFNPGERNRCCRRDGDLDQRRLGDPHGDV